MKTICCTRVFVLSVLIAALAGVSPRAAQSAPSQAASVGASTKNAKPPSGGKGTPNQPQEPDSDGDGLFDSEEPNILVDVNHPELGFLDPFNPDTGDTGKPDGQKDSDHDGITNLGELRKFGSAPSNAHTFSATKDDAEYLFTARPFQNDTMALVDIANLGGGVFQFTISGANANASYDLYFVNNLFAQRWQWRRVYSGVQCNGTGQATFQLQGPDPNQAFFIILSAEDTDFDGLTDGYESWFPYNGQRTIVDDPDSEGDLMFDGWEVEYGLNPMSDTGDDGLDGNPDNDGFINFHEHNAYSFTDGSFDPFKAYNTPANRPVVSISSSCGDSSFTISRAVGLGGTLDNPLTVYYSVGGNSIYGTDYTVSPAPPEYPRIFSVVIPAGQQQVTVAVIGSVTPAPGTKSVVVTLTPYSVSPVSQVPVPGDWAYAVDWNQNRTTQILSCAVRCGFDISFLPRNDDASTGLIVLPFTFNYFGESHGSLYVNNNANVTFAAPLGDYTPTSLVSQGMDIIGPFWADVDTRADGDASNMASDIVHYGMGAVGGRAAFGVNWVNVGYYDTHADKLLSAQLILVDRSDIAAGDFDMEFNYCQVQWEAGDSSGGQGGIYVGPGGSPARAGFASAGGSTFEFAASGQPGAFLDSNSTTGLIYGSFNSSSQPGRYVFQFRNGVPLATP